MDLFTMSSCLTMREWNEVKLVTNETVRLTNKTSFLFLLLLLFNFIIIIIIIILYIYIFFQRIKSFKTELN